MREELLKKIHKQQYDLEQALPIVSLEDFFEGNNDEGSIGCNILEHPGIEKFYKILKEIRDKKNVQDVLVEIYEVDEDVNLWPFSERVYILCYAEKEEISEWLKELQPSDIGEGYEYSENKFVPALKENYKALSIWWD